MSSILDYTDRNTCVLFGDGGGGVMLERAKDSDSGVIDSILRTDGSGSDYLKIPGGGSLHPASYETVDQHLHYIRQDGQVVFKYAIKGMADISEEILKKNNIDSNSISLYVPHQANKRIIDGAAQRCGFKDDQVYININKYGNTTAGTIPICLDEAKELGRINNGDLILLAAFGAGFTWGSMLIRWGK